MYFESGKNHQLKRSAKSSSSDFLSFFLRNPKLCCCPYDTKTRFVHWRIRQFSRRDVEEILRAMQKWTQKTKTKHVNWFPSATGIFVTRQIIFECAFCQSVSKKLTRERVCTALRTTPIDANTVIVARNGFPNNFRWMTAYFTRRWVNYGVRHSRSRPRSQSRDKSVPRLSLVNFRYHSRKRTST